MPDILSHRNLCIDRDRIVIAETSRIQQTYMLRLTYGSYGQTWPNDIAGLQDRNGSDRWHDACITICHARRSKVPKGRCKMMKLILSLLAGMGASYFVSNCFSSSTTPTYHLGGIGITWVMVSFVVVFVLAWRAIK